MARSARLCFSAGFLIVYGSHGREQIPDNGEVTALVSTTMPPPQQISSPAFRPSARAYRRILRWVLALTLAAAATPAWVLLRPILSGNLGVVDPGRVIRAAQPTSRLEVLIKEHHLASILNLRGGSSRDWWYTAEVRTAEKSGVAFFDVPLNATRRPSRRDLLVLIDLFEHCTYPLLIHCKAGADRTGLASAIYLMTQRGEPPRQAARSFSIYHSHLPVFGTERLHEPLDEYAAWLEANSLRHTPPLFRDWVKNEYCCDDPAVDPAPVVPGPRKPLPQDRF